MNIQEKNILNKLYNTSFENQRLLSEQCGHSLGLVNKCLKNLTEKGYLSDTFTLTRKAEKEIESNKPKNAIILAAGSGMRMLPINTEVPKAFLEINNETLIERIIRQLHEVGITEIYVVVGFMKEQFEFLIDEYNVELIVNDNYSATNNLHSLSLVADKLGNSYIIPSDVWCKENPFNKCELYSWYMVSDMLVEESNVKVNRKQELILVSDYSGGNSMIGISYLTKEDALSVGKKMNVAVKEKKYNNAFWEEMLYENKRMIAAARVVDSANTFEVNTYEQLRELDNNSNQLKSEAIEVIENVFDVKKEDIKNIQVLKKGMTNRSFLFWCKNKQYIMRIPGEGTDKLINRKNETEVYKKISDKDLCENLYYVNEINGYKITEFINGARVCDKNNINDLTVCMNRLKEFHNMELSVEHTFDLFGQIEFYESLRKGKPSVYRDYARTKENIFSLKKYIEENVEKISLAHIDAVPDNFLLYEEKVRLIDWEYAGMQDPHVDVAMFCVYALYEKDQIDRLIDIYFENNCTDNIRYKIYCYIAVCGLLWSNWCEYKNSLGIEFGEYSLKQYRYAKEYYKLVKDKLNLREG